MWCVDTERLLNEKRVSHVGRRFEVELALRAGYSPELAPPCPKLSLRAVSHILQSSRYCSPEPKVVDDESRCGALGWHVRVRKAASRGIPDGPRRHSQCACLRLSRCSPTLIPLGSWPHSKGTLVKGRRKTYTGYSYTLCAHRSYAAAARRKPPPRASSQKSCASSPSPSRRSAAS